MCVLVCLCTHVWVAVFVTSLLLWKDVTWPSQLIKENVYLGFRFGGEHGSRRAGMGLEAQERVHIFRHNHETERERLPQIAPPAAHLLQQGHAF